MASAADMLLRGRRLDVRLLAAETGVGRTTLYRWFGTRADLLGEALWVLIDRAWLQARRDATGRGVAHVLRVIETFLTAMRDSAPAVSLIEQEPRLAVLAIMSPTGHVQRRAVARTEQLLHESCDLSTAEERALAEVLTQVSMTYVWAHLLTGAAGELATPLAIADRLLLNAK